MQKMRNGLRRGTVVIDLCIIYGSTSQTKGTGKTNMFSA